MITYKIKSLPELTSYELNNIVENIDDADYSISLILRDIENRNTVNKLNKTRQNLDELRIKIAKEQIKKDKI